MTSQLNFAIAPAIALQVLKARLAAQLGLLNLSIINT
jgi:hypothetical protein